MFNTFCSMYRELILIIFVACVPERTVSIVTTPNHTHHHHTQTVSAEKEVWYCSFNDDQCSLHWQQDPKDDFDWSYVTGPSLTPDTGPASGYGGSGHYMVMDAGLYGSGKKAKLQSVIMNANMVNLTFWYSMYGHDVGRLRVLISYGGDFYEMWSKTGDTGTRAWLQQTLWLMCLKSCRVVFEAEHGVFNHGDIAIDEITAVLTRRQWRNPRVLTDFCNFDKDFCNWKLGSNNGAMWERWNGSTPKRNTGPSVDYTTGHGKYVLFRDSNDVDNYIALLTSVVFRVPFHRRVNFAYHMLQYQNQTSQLNLYKKLESTGTRTLLWKIDRKEGILNWRRESITVTSQEPYMIEFEAIGGSGGYGDIAIDDVEIISGVLPGIIDCTFNGDFRTWSQSTNDDFDWQLLSGSTPTSETGPSDGSSYAYTETSYPRVTGDVAILESQSIGPLGNQHVCVRFSYNMFGRDIGSLQMMVIDQMGNATIVFGLSTNQGRLWRSAYANIHFVGDEVYKVHMISKRGNGILGDIAIRNLVTEMKPCTESTNYHCDFESKCDWTHSTLNIINWTLVRGGKNTDLYPYTDHTTGTNKGGYILLWNSTSVSGFQVNVLKAGPMCVSFWFFTYGGDDRESLECWTQSYAQPKKIIWSYNLQTIKWQHFKIEVTLRLGSMVFQGKATTGYKAIDDIVVTAGRC